MPRLNQFTMSITTGEAGLDQPPRCKFNTHPFTLENASGGTGPGETYSGEFSPRSFVHGFTLVGPEEGTWEVARVDMHYETDEGEYDLSFGPATLTTSNELNLWYGRPAEAWDV